MDTTKNPVAEDYSAYVEVSTDNLGRLSELADLQANMEARVDSLEKELESAKSDLRHLTEVEIPDLMDKVGMEQIKTKSGLVINVEEKIRASIPKARQPEAFDWLRENGHAALIKRVISVVFGKGEDELAASLLSELAQEYEVDEKTSVHSSTLASFVKKQLAKGEEFPVDLFGVHRQRYSKLGV